MGGAVSPVRVALQDGSFCAGATPLSDLCPEPTPAFPKEIHTSFIMSSLARLGVSWVLNKLVSAELRLVGDNHCVNYS